MREYSQILREYSQYPASRSCVTAMHSPSRAISTQQGQSWCQIPSDRIFQKYCAQVVQYYKIFIFSQIPFNITFNNINWYWQNAICKANVSARNNIDTTKRKTKYIAKENKTTKLGAQGQHLPVLCQICYWFHSGSTLEAPWTRFPGNEANFGPNLHILIAPLSQRSISNFSKLNTFANH